MTQAVIGRDLWVREYVQTIYGAARFGAYYIALNDKPNGIGFMLSTADPRESVIKLQDFFGYQSMWDDILADDTMAMRHVDGNSVVMRLTPRDFTASGQPLVFSWRSKEFFLAQPTNFAALMVNADDAPMTKSPNDYVAGIDLPPVPPDATTPPSDGTLSPDDLHARMGRTSLIGMMGLGSYGAYINEWPGLGTLPPGAAGPGWEGWPNWPPIGEGRDPVNDLTLPTGVLGIVRLYANRVLVYKAAMQPNRQVRLPSGFRSTTWQITIVARIPIYSIHIATHGRELAGV
jgi:hypothetical protein